MEQAENFRDIYEIRFFEEFSLPLKMEIIEKGQIIYVKDISELYEFFFKFRKLWAENQFRIKYII